MQIESPPVLSQLKEIVKITEASPLYIEDLLRFMAVIPVDEAIRVWAEKGGNEARQFALGRELDLLSDAARRVLIAACLGERAISYTELQAVSGFAVDKLTGALGELQRLFLVPKPILIEGEQRFDVNINTRALVRQVLSSTDMYRRLEITHKRISGELPNLGRGYRGALIRQAMLQVRNREFKAAESLLQRALDKYVDDSDITGFLGWVYKAWEPQQTTQAREQFKRAWQLKCQNEEMYKHWSRMEIDSEEWTGAAEAAECGLTFMPSNVALLYLAGYSRSRLGRELYRELRTERAFAELEKAQSYLERGVKEAVVQRVDRELSKDIYRAVVLNCESLNNKSGLRLFFHDWRDQHPDDPILATEWERLSTKFQL